MKIVIPQRVLDRFFDNVDVRGEDECWLWTRSLCPAGYGQVGWGEGDRRSSSTTAQRVAWTAANGPIPDGLTVDHLCFVRACCNPAHLRLLTASENGANNRQSRQTHCKHGHPFSGDNLIVRPNGRGRDCRTCANWRSGKIRRRRRLAAAVAGLEQAIAALSGSNAGADR